MTNNTLETTKEWTFYPLSLSWMKYPHNAPNLLNTQIYMNSVTDRAVFMGVTSNKKDVSTIMKLYTDNKCIKILLFYTRFVKV